METFRSKPGGFGMFRGQSSGSHRGRLKRNRPGWMALLALGIAIPGVLVDRQASAQDVVANVRTDFRQAANNDSGTCGVSPGHPCGLGHAHWINSIVQQSNARYFEGMSNPQRLIFLDIDDTAGSPKEVHTLSLNHQATKRGIHAYDFLTSWEQAQAAAAEFTPPAGGLLFDLFVDNCGKEIGPPASMEATCTSLKGGANCVDVTVPDDPYVDTNDGSYQSRIDAYEALFGDRTIRICGDQPINSASLILCNHSGPDAGDSNINYILQWSSDSNEVVIKFAGHLAVSGDPNVDPLAWGINQGAGAISGGPYHITLNNLGGALTVGPPTCTQSNVSSLGSQDNQIKGADILFCRPGCGDGSTCTNGLCGDGSPCGTTTCDDGIACTNDSCDETNNVCFHTPSDSKCDDGNECTFNVCDRTNPAADANGCVFPPVAENTPCTSDGVPCTDDVCQGGVCTHKPDDTACDDMRTCTLDKCVPADPGADANGCLYNPNDAACDDGIDCTNDSCDPAHPAANAVSGCVNVADDSKCPDDGLFCNGTAVCDSMAGCVATGDPCGGATPLCCEDSDSCAAECCFDSDCDDLLFCTGVETCVGGVCVDGPDPCTADNCDCTNDFCQESTDTCVHAPNNAFCKDSLFCNGQDFCDPSVGSGTCCVSPGNPCTEPLQCNEDKDLCLDCLDDEKCSDGQFCNGLEICDETTQMCGDGPDPCPEDNITCTIINCLETSDTCETKLMDSACDDGIACTTDACDPMNPLADPVTGCVHTPNHGSCNDMNECTNDACVPTSCTPPCSGCVNTPKSSGTPCGNQTPKGVCDNPDVCDETGQCSQNPKPADTVCRPSTGDCDPAEFCDGMSKDCPADVCEASGTPCPDDGNECTDDVCDGLCHCTHPPKPDNTACTDDGIVCTKDVCLGGVCVHTPEPLSTPCGNQTVKGVCDNPDHCNGMGNCVQNAQPAGTVCGPAVSECDVTEFCDGTSKDCPADVCRPEGSPCADDGDPCTDDVCDGFCGCTHTDNCGTPNVICPPDKVFECDAVGDFGDPTVEDACNPAAQAECTEDATPGKLPLEQTIIRTCTYTNYCGRMVSCEQRIDIVDTTPPVVTCPEDCTLECGEVLCVPPNCDDPSCDCGGVATCEDNCSTCSVTVTCEVVPADCRPGAVAGITPPPKLVVERTFTGTESTTAVTATGEGNVGTCVQRIEIVDTNPPELLDCPGPITICDKNDSLPFTPPTCTDICGTCDVTCVRSDNLPLHDPVPVGPITVTCVAADECLNESSCAFGVELSEFDECFIAVPTVSEWGLVVLTLLLLTGAKIYFGRRRVETA